MDTLNYNFKRSPVSVAVVNITFKDSYKNFSRSSPVQNAVGNGVESRAILNFNGTQYATLGEPVVLDGDFEIECLGALSDFIGSGFWGGYNFGLLTDSEGVLRFVLPREDIAETPRYTPIGELTYLDLNKINSISVGRRGNEFFMCLNNQSEKTQTLTDIDNALSVQYMGVMDLGSGLNRHLDGSIFSARIWKNGDRNTGELVTNLRFDEPDTIYQRNYAVPVESGLLGNNLWATPTYYPNGVVLVNTPDSVTVQGSTTEGETRAVKHIDYVFSPGTTYRVSGNVTGGSESLAVFIREGSSAGVGSVVSGSGVLFSGEKFEFLFTATSTDHNIQISKAAAAEIGVEGLEIETFSGAILENTLPGDWEEISKKSGDDFWLGVELSQVSSSELLGDDSDPEFQDVAPVVAGYVYEAYAAVSHYSGIADTGWSTGGALGGSNTGIPGEPPFRVGKPDIGSIVGGIFYSQENNIVRLYGRSTSIAGFSNISVKRYLEYAEGAL